METVAARMPRIAELAPAYRDILLEIAGSEASTRARTMRLSDDLVVVVQKVQRFSSILQTMQAEGARAAAQPSRES